MNPNIIGLLISFGFVFLVLGIATLIAKFTKGASENSRKFVHIVVGHWVFILLMFNQLWAAVLVPFSFIIVNYLSTRFKIFKAMERNDNSYGTVYYAISLTFLVGLGFYLKWLALPFIGVLTMAYGDGFAAIVGKKWGTYKPFSFAPDKSLAGSLTVTFFSFIITALCLYFFQGQGSLVTQSIWIILLIALLTAIFSTFIELTGHQGCDNLTLPIGSGLFAVLLFQFGSLPLYLFMLGATAILLVAYFLKAITIDGIVAALLIAITLYALLDFLVGIALIAFFLLGSVVSKIKNKRKIEAEGLQEKGGPRTWKQVIANSLPAAIFAWLYLILNQVFPGQYDFILLLALAVFTAATADTISSEIGMLSKETSFHILTFKKYPRGISGGVTFTGLIAGIIGSFLVATIVFINPLYGVTEYLVVAILGVLGTLVDSILGALFQRKYINNEGMIVEASETITKPYRGFKFVTNNVVNLVTLFVVSISGFIYYLIVLF